MLTERFSIDMLKFISNKIGIRADLLELYNANYIGNISQDLDIYCHCSIETDCLFYHGRIILL